MALTLRTAITADQTTFDVLGSDDLQPGDLKTLDSETIVIRTAKASTLAYLESARYRVSVYRGTGGTRAAAHAANATLTTYSAGGGGGGVTVTGITGGSVADATEIQTPGTVKQVSAGVASTGGSVVVSASDPGAIGEGNLWLEVVFGDGNGDGGYGRLWVRNSTDDGWNSGSPMAFSTSTGTLISSPDDNAELSLASAGNDSYVQSAQKLSLRASGGVAVDIGGADAVIRLSGAPVQFGAGPTIRSGALDPSAGAGVAAELASLYLRNDGLGAGEMWLKIGTIDTGWSKVTTS